MSLKAVAPSQRLQWQYQCLLSLQLRPNEDLLEIGLLHLKIRVLLHLGLEHRMLILSILYLPLRFASRSFPATVESADSLPSSADELAQAEASRNTTTAESGGSANKYIPAVIASIFVVLAAAILVFCLQRRRKLAKRRAAQNEVATSPYQLPGSDSSQSLDEKAYAHYKEDPSVYQPNGLLSQSQDLPRSDPPRSFFNSIRNTILRRQPKASPQPPQNPWDWQANVPPESPPIPKVPIITQVPSAAHDPFRDGFSGAAQLATGLASTMTSQVSLDKLSDEGQSQCALSYKQSLSSTASTSLARRWPEPVARDGHESLSQGPNVRTLYNGVHLEDTAEEQDVFDDAYGEYSSDVTNSC